MTNISVAHNTKFHQNLLSSFGDETCKWAGGQRECPHYASILLPSCQEPIKMENIALVMAFP
jgi:hypothetical protein